MGPQVGWAALSIGFLPWRASEHFEANSGNGPSTHTLRHPCWCCSSLPTDLRRCPTYRKPIITSSNNLVSRPSPRRSNHVTGTRLLERLGSHATESSSRPVVVHSGVYQLKTTNNYRAFLISSLVELATVVDSGKRIVCQDIERYTLDWANFAGLFFQHSLGRTVERNPLYLDDFATVQVPRSTSF